MAEVCADAIQAFVEDVKQCKDDGWEEMGFISPGLCVAYYAEAHAPSNVEWSHRDWARGWDNDDWRDEGTGVIIATGVMIINDCRSPFTPSMFVETIQSQPPSTII